MDRFRRVSLSRMSRLALAVPLVCAVIISSLWLGQQLRAYRAPEDAAALPAASPTLDASSQAGAPSLRQQPTQFIKLPPGVTDQLGNVVFSPDGTYFVTRSTDFTQLAVVRVRKELDTVTLTSELVATLPDLTFVAWLPDGKSFAAEGTQVVSSTGKASMKTYDVFRVTTGGATQKIGEALGGPLALSPDAKLIAAFDGDSRLIAIAVDGSATRALDDPISGTAPALLGWDGQGRVVRADYRTPFAIVRVPLAGKATATRLAGVTGVSNARWSPDHAVAIVSVSTPSERDALLTEAGIVDLPAGALPAWIGPHILLTRAADERAGSVDALTGARATFNAKMRSDNIRVIAATSSNVLWLDEAKNVPHLLDVAADRDTGLGLNPWPTKAQPLTDGRFVTLTDRLMLLDAAAWWQVYVHPTPTPLPQSKDQGAVAAGSVRVESPEGGWSVVMPKTWYRRDAPMHGSEVLSYDPDGMDYSGNLPPAGQVRVVIEVMNDYGVPDAREYAKTNTLGMGTRTNESDLTIAGQPAYAATFASASPPPWPNQRMWYVRSPYWSDRIFVIQATANVRAAEVDGIIASLRFFKPAAPAAATVTRAQVMAQYTQPTYSATRVDKVEAKLVRWKDYEKAMGFRSGTNDPDELTWVVVVYGEIQPPSRRPSTGKCTRSARWQMGSVGATAAAGRTRTRRRGGRRSSTSRSLSRPPRAGCRGIRRPDRVACPHLCDGAPRSAG